ncbi:Protein of unknown function DUF2625 [Chitinophaga costaii]|uniref:DUF2625 domain-containing protein n=1 Tax=Chitinophaga costaii TaxID=1335309 RepID=A0A1C3Z0Y4_9BACT|nr:DUF2625 domain-containing protein [Chitinophaga costaii]PUZ30185.1 DUF2625 domain-containing protein [Chitinophaga costaii]SCB75930.1 Protein of unknown function DUF2625 [Chitinophaga costaii]
MKSLETLVNTTEPGWPLVEKWIAAATNLVEVLPCDLGRAATALYQTQVSTRSPMGAIIYATGGILIDHGWLRILASGHERLHRSLPVWNLGKSFEHPGEAPGFLLVADDVMGGLFAINGGALGDDAGKLYYLAPDTMQWEAMDVTYSGFLNFCFNGNLAKFYQNLRWPGWEVAVAALDGDTVFNCFPFLWTKEGKDITQVTRRPMLAEDQYQLNMELRKQMGGQVT